MNYYKCDYADEIENGYCKHKKCKCDGNVYFDFDTVLETIDKKDICKESRLWGNYYIKLTDENIKQLKSGCVLALTDEEYNIFIAKQ